MKKIPTLFHRIFDGHKKKEITDQVTPGLEWVLAGEGIATVKYDGSCCAVIDREFYKRYDAKHGKPVPEGAIKCQEEADPVSGHLPCWVKVSLDAPEDKWLRQARNNYEGPLKDGTYEAIGPHFQSNPYRLNMDTLIRHGMDIIDVPRTFEGIRDYLKQHNIEGIVFWKDGEHKCKIKRSDFGFPWPEKQFTPFQLDNRAGSDMLMILELVERPRFNLTGVGESPPLFSSCRLIMMYWRS